MLKDKYVFDPETGAYVKVKKSKKQRLIKLFAFFGLCAAIAGGMVFVLYTFFGSPKERKLQKELVFLNLQYKDLKKDLNQVNLVLEDIQERDDNIYRTIFEAEPISQSIRNAGLGGARRYEQLEAYEHSEEVIETKKELDYIRKKLYVQSRSFDEVLNLTKGKEEMIASIPAIQPVANKDLKRMASGFGYRIHPIYKTRKFHYGMDFTAPRNTPIYATGNAVVSQTRRSGRGYGNSIKLDHGYGYETFYAHMQSFNVKKGDKVKRGDVIGFVGNTGTSTAPHLHYEVYKNGAKVNPVNYYFNDLTAEEYDRMINLSTQENQSFD